MKPPGGALPLSPAGDSPQCGPYPTFHIFFLITLISFIIIVSYDTNIYFYDDVLLINSNEFSHMLLNPTSTTYNSLLLAYQLLNDKLFKSTLPFCLITLQREKKSFGYFCANKFTHNDNLMKSTDEIALNPQYFRSPGRDDRMVISTLAHEMCHLWQHHHGKPGRSRYHNKEWATKMRSIGLIPSDTGKPGGKDIGDAMTHYIDDSGLFAQAFTHLKNKGFALEWIEYLPLIKEALVLGKIDPGEIVTASNVETLSSPRKVDTSKLKYTCPSCNLNAWAKIGANLVCGDCEEPMVYQELN